jgi:hypothetical protein
VHGHGEYVCVWCSPAGHSSGMPAGPLNLTTVCCEVRTRTVRGNDQRKAK